MSDLGQSEREAQTTRATRKPPGPPKGAKARTTPWPRAVQTAIDDARREGYLCAIEDVYGAILAGDLHTMLINLRRREGLDDTEPLCLTIEHKIALGHR